LSRAGSVQALSCDGRFAALAPFGLDHDRHKHGVPRVTGARSQDSLLVQAAILAPRVDHG
jgi:hypothetical protein